MAKRKTLQAGASAAPPPDGPPPPKPKKLSWNQERFVEEYVKHGNRTLAYRNAYPGCSPSACRQAGARLLSNVVIQEAIDLRKRADSELLNFGRIDALKILVGMATASLDDFTEVFKGADDKKNFRGLGLKRYAIESAKKTTVTQEDGSTKEVNEIKIVSPSERRAIVCELWEKLGLGEGSGKANWFDGFDRLAELISGTERKK